MSKQLYEEALADARRLKEVAEDNAKRALVEAVTPRIRDLIEKELLKEVDESDEEVDEGFEMEVHGEPGGSPMHGQLITDDEFEPAFDSDAISPPDEEGKVTLDLDALFADEGGAEVEPPLFGDQFSVGNEYALNRESIEALTPLIMSSKAGAGKEIEASLYRIGEHLKTLTSASQIIKETRGYNEQISKMISQIENIYAYVQESVDPSAQKSEYENKLESYFSELNKLQENNKMKNRFSRLMNEADVTLKLTGLPDEIDLDSVGVDLITGEEGEEGEEMPEEGGEEGEELDFGEEGEEMPEEGGEEGGEELDLDLGGEEEEPKTESRRLRDNVIVEIDEGMLRREISRMKALREDKVPSTKGAGPGKLDDFGGGDDEGDPFLDIDLREADGELDEIDFPTRESDMYEADEDEIEELYQVGDRRERDDFGGSATSVPSRDKGNPADRHHEALRRERMIQTEAKKKAHAAKKKKTEAQQKAQQKMKEAQKCKQSKQQKEAQKKQKEAAACKKQAKQMHEAYEFFADKYNTSVRREAQIRRAINESARNSRSTRSAGETENLRNKLSETNLYNAKLLYTNRLLQNESLSKRQKAEIIERLDEAKNIREVKLVYESLSKTLEGTSRPLSETTERKVLGSSSRATRPASTNLNEGFETDRWARLAGINK
jgi:hypothetical protein